MGLGGYLTWTAVAREIRKQAKDAKMFPVELKGHFLKIIDSEVFHNNPDFLSYTSSDYKDQLVFPLMLNSPAANYCKKDTPERAYHRGDSHIISQICEIFGIENPELKCVLNLTQEEKLFAENFQESIDGDRFITIEPFSKDNYTPNRAYPFEKWQNVVDILSREINVVQVGNPGKVLNNTINMTGNTTFREAISIIERSDMFLASV